ncbi:unnamed protein product, partial [Clonostachys solani]
TEDLTIYYNDSIDSDNATAALTLLKEVAQRCPTKRGVSMSEEEFAKCKKLLIMYFLDIYKTDRDASKALLGSCLKGKKLLER